MAFDKRDDPLNASLRITSLEDIRVLIHYASDLSYRTEPDLRMRNLLSTGGVYSIPGTVCNYRNKCVLINPSADDFDEYVERKYPGPPIDSFLLSDWRGQISKERRNYVVPPLPESDTPAPITAEDLVELAAIVCVMEYVKEPRLAGRVRRTKLLSETFRIQEERDTRLPHIIRQFSRVPVLLYEPTSNYERSSEDLMRTLDEKVFGKS